MMQAELPDSPTDSRVLLCPPGALLRRDPGENLPRQSLCDCCPCLLLACRPAELCPCSALGGLPSLSAAACTGGTVSRPVGAEERFFPCRSLSLLVPSGQCLSA